MKPHTTTAILLLFSCTVCLFAQKTYPGNPKTGLPAVPFRTTEEELKMLQDYASPGYWRKRFPIPVIDREKFIRSIEGIRAYYLNQQLPEGNFLYAMDITTGEKIQEDNQVRQAGALWGLASLNRDRFTEATRRAALKGLNFFIRNQKELPTGETVLTYPGDQVIKTGTVALYCLSVIDFIRGQKKLLPPEFIRRYEDSLNSHLLYLRNMEMPDGSWAEEYDIRSGYRVPHGSPYYDGETMLAYIRAARYLGHKELIPRIEKAMPRLVKKYTINCWKPGQMDDTCKGFSQWGCMSIAEYAQAGWKDAAMIARGALAIAWWLVEYDQLESKSGNTGYAVEALMGAWQAARFLKDRKAMQLLEELSRRIMGRLLTLQVDGPFSQNSPFVSLHRRRMPATAAGGVLAGAENGIIRIDNVQHQLHAMLMMLQFLYPERSHIHGQR